MAGIAEIEVKKLRLDEALQMRARLDADVIAQYAEAYRGGAQLPPVVVFQDPGERVYWVADGFHRVRAALEAKRHSLPVELRPGRRRDALLYALGANDSHGLRRTAADRERIMRTVFQDDELAKLADSVIAKICNLDRGTVAAWRERLGARSDVRRGADGVEQRVPSVAGSRNRPQGDPQGDARARVDEQRAASPAASAQGEKPPTDHYGRELPAHALRAWAQDEVLDRLAEELHRVRLGAVQATRQWESTDVGIAWLRTRLQPIAERLAQIERELAAVRPHAVCPYCKGAEGKCPGCRGRAWVTKQEWERAPEVLRLSDAVADDIGHWIGQEDAG